MLSLGRKVGTKIRIGDDIVVKVVQVGYKQVKLGIDAPDHLKILRLDENNNVEGLDQSKANLQ
jgi:carbon storage regulator